MFMDDGNGDEDDDDNRDLKHATFLSQRRKPK